MMELAKRAGDSVCFPAWVPPEARRYIAHTEGGAPIRALARIAGCHASTILRQIRNFETRRDDRLVDEALRRLGQHVKNPISARPSQTETTMTEHQTALSKDELTQECLRILPRLSEKGAVLAVASDMDKAVVVRDVPGGGPVRSAVVDLQVAQALALKEWIKCDSPGRISRYHITGAGRSALSRLMAEAENAAQGFSEARAAFAPRHPAPDASAEPSELPRRARYHAVESPLILLARRREKDGSQFLSPDLVRAGERLREDFELAQMAPRTTQNWDSFLTAPVEGTVEADRSFGPDAARDRVANALRDLGPGLGDVVLRCCCYLEGLEKAEKTMGWSARSAKIVLRIALQRLKRHYEELGDKGAMIG